ncbi:hypothetical protein BDZ45DRAFT_764932 [Acephala macrosclerotiorum]|nr:hypothetical protein BDZ45DRAFT_764932 [Acephala macrosclerotiorum]
MRGGAFIDRHVEARALLLKASRERRCNLNTVWPERPNLNQVQALMFNRGNVSNKASSPTTAQSQPIPQHALTPIPKLNRFLSQTNTHLPSQARTLHHCQDQPMMCNYWHRKYSKCEHTTDTFVILLCYEARHGMECKKEVLNHISKQGRCPECTQDEEAKKLEDAVKQAWEASEAKGWEA